MSKPDTWKSWEGRRVDGKFPLRQWLGGSEHSAVFLTEISGKPGQKAAIKLMSAESGPQAESQLSRLRAAAKLSHPNLIRIFDAGRAQINGDPLVYVVMEFAEEDLSQILPQRPLEPAEVSDLLPPLLGALSYLHGSGRVHGRIKPSNVLAVGDQLKLSSDQVALVADQNSQLRRRDTYDAPETAAGIISTAGDVWSVGATMVAALTQNVSFADQESAKDPVLRGNIPEPFRGIARECLHLDPKRRCSLSEIQARLQPGARSVPAETSRPSSPAPPVKRGRAFAVTLVLVLPLGIVFAVVHSRGSKSAVENPDRAQQAPIATPTTAPAPAVPESPNPAEKPHTANGAVAHQVLPDIPQSAKNTIRGTIKVVVRVSVDTSGKVTGASLKSAGSSRYFAGQAQKAAQRWEFSPPQSDGQPAASTWLVQFRFRRTSTDASAQPTSR